MASLSRADQRLGELAGLGRLLPNPFLLARPYMRKEAELSSRIEGTNASLSELFHFESSNERTSRPPDVKEVHNYVRALEYGLKRLDTLPISLRLVRELHERLMSGVRGGDETPGEFRRNQNWIGAAGCSLREAEYVPPPPEKLDACLREWERFIHESVHMPSLMRAAVTHYQFEAIHPFRDGNGRIGRLLIVLQMHAEGILPYPLLYLSAYFNQRRREYYDRLCAVTTEGDWDGWMKFFLRGVEEQALDAVRRSEGLVRLREEYVDRLSEASSPQPARLVPHLFEHPVLTIPQAERCLGVSYPTAKNAVEELVGRGILERMPGGEYAKRFSASEIISVLQRDRA